MLLYMYIACLLFYFFYPTSVSILWRMCVCVCVGGCVGVWVGVCVCASARVYIYLYIYIHTHTHTHIHIWLLRNYIRINRCYHTIMRVKHFYTVVSGAKCWLDIYHRNAELTVTGRILDIGQSVIQSYDQTGSSSSPQSLPQFLLYRIPRGGIY